MEDVLSRMRAKYGGGAKKAVEEAKEDVAPKADTSEDGTDDPNKLGALAMEAMLAGDMERYEVLNKRLEAAQARIAAGGAVGDALSGGSTAAGSGAAGGGSADVPHGVRVLEEIDGAGRNRAMKESVQTTSVRIKGKNKRGTANAVPGKGGNFSGFYEDDDISLEDLVRKERIEGVQDYDANFARHIEKKGSKFKMIHEEDDEAYGLGMYEHASKTMDAKKRDDKAMKQDVNDKKRIQVNLENCTLCIESKRFGRKDAMISTSDHVYLCMDAMNKCIVPGQCFIAPIEHLPAVTEMEDAVWTEIRNYQKCLVRFFEAENPPRAVIFAESVVTKVSRDKALLGAGAHTCIIAYPVDLGLLDEVRAFWKKALDEVEDEFEVQHKQVIVTEAKGGVRNKVPKGFPYVHADFSLGGGYAHVIENPHEFPRDFVQHTVAGMCELTVLDRAYHDRDSYRRACEGFKKKFSDGFDWTAALRS